MNVKNVSYAFLLVCGILALAGLTVLAEDKKEDKGKAALTGKWTKKEGELKMEFCDKEVMKFYPHGDKLAFAIVCNYSFEKDGRVKVKITELEGTQEIKDKAKGSLPIGLEFSFKYKVKDSAATLDEVKGDNVEHLKTHLEGDYEKNS